MPPISLQLKLGPSRAVARAVPGGGVFGFLARFHDPEGRALLGNVGPGSETFPGQPLAHDFTDRHSCSVSGVKRTEGAGDFGGGDVGGGGVNRRHALRGAGHLLGKEKGK